MKPFQTNRVVVTQVSENIQTVSADNPEKLRDFWREVIATQPDYEPDKESLCVLMMNTKFDIFAWNRVSLGTIEGTIAHPREVMRPVIVAAAYAFALMHNHPSGDPMPSRQDEQITRRVVEVSYLMNISFTDHVIVGSGDRYYSFQEAGLIQVQRVW
jgi:DNA repair protein RadC